MTNMALKKYVNERFVIAVDCIIFGFDGLQLKILLIKRGFEPEKGSWSLIGGFVGSDESSGEAAERVLKKLTGLKKIYLEQVHCFSEVDRDPVERVVSIAHFALINLNDAEKEILHDYGAQWFPLNRLPKLVFDHRTMVKMALEKLRDKVSSHPVGFELLPQKFTLPQLQSLYEAIYEMPLDKRNFSRKMLSLGILNKLKEKEKESSRKGAFFYVFDRERYRKLHKEGVNFI